MQVAAKVGLNTSKEAEDRIVAMIQEGSIHARVSQKDGRYRKNDAGEVGLNGWGTIFLFRQL